MTDFEGWADSPPPTRRGRWQRVTDQLAAHPGRWAVIESEVTVARSETVARGLRRQGATVKVQRAGAECWTVWACVPAMVDAAVVS